MSPAMWTILLSSLATGTIITMSSHHWLLAWIGLEINTLAILPIIAKQHHPRATEATTKYFLIQAATAATILFATTLNAWTTGQWTITQLQNQQATALFTLAIATKLGLVPVHFWFPEVMQGSTLTTALIISTWQKLAPLSIIYMTTANLNLNMLITLGLLSTILGGLLGLNQTQTRKIMAYSSITHMGWLIMAFTFNMNITTLTLIFYLVMTTSMFTTLLMSTAKSITDLGLAWPNSPTMLVMTMITLLSLAGLPPLSGFAPKWLILVEMTKTSLTTLSTIMALATLPSLFFYLRLAYLTIMTNPPTPMTTQHSWRSKPKFPKMTPQLIITTMMLLPIMPLTQNFIQ
uniref:NADH dehydrogenase subunit 2 n=1 Tax=Goniurosaurus bawanglingensis TaxID=2234022 RepID=UPI002A839244|nr:NADH dehydrogenase subunit 2 [Goniurosaurus bawanglingensis]WOA02148.1 NADH dehydrogenase subunit 2 [Goniurosaurus bawanglingensis]